MTAKIKIPARLLPFLQAQHKRSELQQAELALIQAQTQKEQAEQVAFTARLNPPWYLRRDVEFILAVGVASIVIGTWFLANLRPLLAADEELPLKKAELAQTNANLQKLENDSVKKDNARITEENKSQRLALKRANASFEAQLVAAKLKSEAQIEQQAAELNALRAQEKSQSIQKSQQLATKLAETEKVLQQSKADLQSIKAAQEKASERGDALVGIPKMTTIPGGSFIMGSDDSRYNEKPAHKVTLDAFQMMETEETFTLWDACVEDKGCSNRPDDEGWGRGNRPVIYVSWEAVTGQFIPWLNNKTGKAFRLPSEA
jgi:hypothetical protein